MSGHRPFSELKKSVEARPGARERIDAEKRAMREALRLSELRGEIGVTQVEMAQRVGVSQANISRIEREEDVYLSTLSGYVEALGGELQLNAVFPEKTIAVTLRPQSSQRSSATKRNMGA
jgi:DNA-binding XRE family transcriptional regulator